MMINQTSFWDEKIDKTKLGGFVYALVDPRDNSIFYIGKGGGTESKGNERPNHHLKEALEYRISPDKISNYYRKSKLQTINNIWAANQLVQLVIIRRGMDAKTTSEVEAALIQTLKHFNNDKLTNIVEKFRNSSNGFVDKSNAVILYAEELKEFDGEVTLWLFPIKNGLKSKNAFDATVASWRVSNKNLNNLGYAIGIDEDQISRVVIKMNCWVKDPAISNKWKIDGVDISHDLGRHFFEKRFKKLLIKDYTQVLMKESAKNHSLGYWSNGNYMIVRIKNNEVHYEQGNKLYGSILI